jgi:hypothetical protein
VKLIRVLPGTYDVETRVGVVRIAHGSRRWGREARWHVYLPGFSVLKSEATLGDYETRWDALEAIRRWEEAA